MLKSINYYRYLVLIYVINKIITSYARTPFPSDSVWIDDLRCFYECMRQTSSSSSSQCDNVMTTSPCCCCCCCCCCYWWWRWRWILLLWGNHHEYRACIQHNDDDYVAHCAKTVVLTTQTWRIIQHRLSQCQQSRHMQWLKWKIRGGGTVLYIQVGPPVCCCGP